MSPRDAVAVAALLAAAPATLGAWDRHAHETMTSVALESTPKPLRDVMASRTRSVIEAVRGPDTPAIAARLHGPESAKDLDELLDGTRDLWRQRRLTPGQLAPRLGTIAHLVSDLLAPETMLAPVGDWKLLDDHRVVLAAEDAPTFPDGASLRREYERLSSVLDPRAVTLRYDAAWNAVRAAWRHVTEREDVPWTRETFVREVGSPWRDAGLSDKTAANDEARRKNRETRAMEAQDVVRKANFEEMSQHGKLKAAEKDLAEAIRIFDAGDPKIDERRRAVEDARASWEAAVKRRQAGEEVERKIVRGEEEAPERPVLEVVDQSLHASFVASTLVVRLRSNASTAWPAVRATLQGTEGAAGTLLLTVSGGQPPGSVRTYEVAFLSPHDFTGARVAYTPLASPPAAATAKAGEDPAAALMAAARAGLDVTPLLAPGSARPLFGSVARYEKRRVEDGREVAASRLRELAAWYDEQGRRLTARTEADPVLLRERKIGERLKRISAALDRDAEKVMALPEGALGTVHVYGVAGEGDWELETGGAASGRVTVRLPWAVARDSWHRRMVAAVERGNRGEAWDAEADPRPALHRARMLGYALVTPSSEDAPAPLVP